MRERPILFSALMVKALLAGTKTQTRRVVKGWPLEWLAPGMFTPEYVADPANAACPYGVPGDKLWVRETWGVGSRPCPFEGGVDGLEYRADEAFLDEGDLLPLYRPTLPADVCLGDFHSGWRPSIHMPRWASRITLNVTGVRVERLQATQEADARAEGVDYDPGEGGFFWVPGLGCTSDSAADSFRQLWSSINGDASWNANPWIWVLEFKRVEA